MTDDRPWQGIIPRECNRHCKITVQRHHSGLDGRMGVSTASSAVETNCFHRLLWIIVKHQIMACLNYDWGGLPLKSSGFVLRWRESQQPGQFPLLSWIPTPQRLRSFHTELLRRHPGMLPRRILGYKYVSNCQVINMREPYLCRVPALSQHACKTLCWEALPGRRTPVESRGTCCSQA